ncbi:MAG: Sec-independent protein translocase protein TatC [Phycisphaerae bacterium]|nr:MAG: Sec-independent protein translocase protein TatC [Phycisphaerae bacterium]
MPLGDHLEELRSRIIWALLGLVPIALVAMGFGKYLLAFLVEPARVALEEAGQDATLIQTNPLEAFGTYMKVSLIAAVIVGSPWMFYQFWRFVAPGLYKHEKRFVYFLLPLSTLLTGLGLVFLFRVILPVILSFLINFGTMIGERPIATAPPAADVAMPAIPLLKADPTAPVPGQMWFNTAVMELRVCVAETKDGPEVRSIPMHRGSGIIPQYRVSEYVSLLLTLTLAFGAAFQAPVVVLLLGWVGLVTPATLNRFRRHAILVCAILAAILMPGDPLSMMLMWLPLMGLYELGGILLRFFPASRVAGKRDEPPDDPTEGEG